MRQVLSQMLDGRYKRINIIDASKTWDWKIAIGYWGDQTEETSFYAVIDAKTINIEKIWLLNFTWDYTDYVHDGELFKG